MLKIPFIDPTVKVVNEVLQPYFKRITQEISPLSEMQRHKLLTEYLRYIEGEAQATKNVAIRLQLRINLAALLERFDYNGPQEEPNVRPRHNGFRVLYEGLYRDPNEEETDLALFAP